MKLTVERTENGWVVMKAGELIAGPFKTSGEAWRWVDKRSNDYVAEVYDRVRAGMAIR